MAAQLDFPPEEFAQRRAALLSALQDQGIACLLALHPSSMHWLTGAQTKGYQGFQCVVVEREADRFTVFTRESEKYETEDTALCDEVACWGSPGQDDPVARLLAFLEARGIAGKVAMEMPAYYLHPHQYLRLQAALSPVETPRLVHDLRLVKSPREIAYLREAARIADRCLVEAGSLLRAGATEREAAAVLYETAFLNGADAPTVPINLASGPRSVYSHGSPSARVLEDGDTGNLEFCIPFKRYTVSLGRQFCVGTPHEDVLALHRVVEEAAAACIAQVRDGALARDAFAAADAVLAAAGHAGDRAHTMGYAVAPAFAPATGEQLGLSATSKDVLRAGMNLSICPNVFLRERRIGVRLVDNILVTAGGAERLSALAPDCLLAG